MGLEFSTGYYPFEARFQKGDRSITDSFSEANYHRFRRGCFSTGNEPVSELNDYERRNFWKMQH